MAKDGNRIKPEPFSIDILLPHYIIQDLEDIAKFHGATMKEEITRVLLQFHAKSMSDLIKGELK